MRLLLVFALALSFVAPPILASDVPEEVACGSLLAPFVVIENVPFRQVGMHFSFMAPRIHVAVPPAAVGPDPFRTAHLLLFDDIGREPVRGWLVSKKGIVQLEGAAKPGEPLRDDDGRWRARMEWARSELGVGSDDGFFRSEEGDRFLWISRGSGPAKLTVLDAANGETVTDVAEESSWVPFGIDAPRTLADIRAGLP